MIRRPILVLIYLPLLWVSSSTLRAEDDLLDLPSNSAEEPKAEAFSLEKATQFLDSAAVHWTRDNGCFTCHTNFLYVAARPFGSEPQKSKHHAEVRGALEDLVNKRWETGRPHSDAEVVMTAAMLALNDAQTSNKLQPTTRKALNKMWDIQREDGGVDWIKCGWPPFESDDDFGVTMMAIAVGAAPDGYAESEEAKVGLDKLKRWLAKHPDPTTHHAAMRLWADSYLPDLLTKEQQEEIVTSLRKLQKEDGGWGLATLGRWKRADGSDQDFAVSDGYGTGFVIFVLRQAGVAKDDPQIQKGLAWLRANQRKSGRWHTRSMHSDGSHYISHAGTAFALMAFKLCE